MTDRVSALEAELALVLRPPVKVSPASSRRSALNVPALEKYRAMCEHVVAAGWSWRRIAREAECTVQFVTEVYAGRRYVPGWLLESFPQDAQAVAVQVAISHLRKVG